MVNPFIKRLIMKLSTTVAKSVFKAYENTIKNHRGGGGGQQFPNPFKEYFEKMSQSNPMAKKVITRDEALKILNMAEKTELNPDEIMENYTKMFIKNDLSKGGSFYIQSKIWVAKEEIMKDFPGAEAEYYKKNEMSDPAKGKKAEATEDKKDAKAEENKEKEDDKPAEEKKAE